jgi:aerobic-type carbon monoxide dehydrogenase small subunit (CoxS/CutS family)
MKHENSARCDVKQWFVASFIIQAGFCGGGQGLSCAVEPRKEEEEEENIFT